MVSKVNPEPRNIIHVINEMLNIIPRDSLPERNLADDLEQYRETLFNKAPEVLRSGECWLPAQNIMNYHYHKVNRELTMVLLNIFNNTNNNV